MDTEGHISLDEVGATTLPTADCGRHGAKCLGMDICTQVVSKTQWRMRVTFRWTWLEQQRC